jgi:glutamyl-tRNA synthetase
VDDHLMGITHVFRGVEWLGTFPLHALVIRAFGWEEPVWCHLSVFLKPSGKGKMSKRDVTSEQSIFVLGWKASGSHPPTVGLRELGYMPAAILNWIALMGASFGDDEDVLTLAEMSARFSLDRLNPAPARVSYDKLDHFSGLYVRRLPAAELAARVKPFFTAAGIAADDEMLCRIAPLIQPRIVTFDDAVPMAGFFFQPAVDPDPASLIAKGATALESLSLLEAARALLAELPSFAADVTEPPLRALAEARGWKPAQLFGILRAAITGQAVSPPLFESMAVIGRPTCLARLDQAASILARSGPGSGLP